ncbi:MAG: 2-oxo acid dehydrogenase subunit E2 [Acidimicrobiia bacterium]|jgi:2-oxoisovalerate dehydrogenase E2 component (dihydrolipoyl transacylase)|nr:MAG: 2-oxo acid dehydrogenase subunit E2 [Acidimicrobiia bacterium]
MARTFNLPDLGEGLTEAEIVEWRVAVGDDVALDQEIVEVETAKASVVIPSPFAGVVLELHGAAGDAMEVGAPLITFADAGEAAEATHSDSAATAPDDEERTPNLVGYGATSDRSRRRRRGTSPSHAASDTEPAPTKPRAKPPVRKLAKDLGVDLGSVRATGKDHTITRDDVQAAATGVPGPATGGTIPVRGVRRTIARQMERSHAIPSAAAWVEADASGLVRLRKALAARHPEERITSLAIVCRLVVEALREVPHLNARWSEEEITLLDDIHLGIAVATDRGLVVPVVRNAHTQSIRELAGSMADKVDGARANTLPPTDLVGSTFTITNFGALGMDGGIPLINHPEVGILGMGRLIDRPHVEAGTVVVRPTVTLSLSFDHRVADGSEASRFLSVLAELVAEPAILLEGLT